MIKKTIASLCVVPFLLLAPGLAVAGCSKQTIKGTFAGQSDFAETEDYWSAYGTFLVQFSGTGKLQLKKLIEGSNGVTNSGNGSGTYSVQSNCTGVANINIKQGGVTVARGKLDFVIGGTKATPEILGLYTNKADSTSGNLRMIKSSF